MAREPAPSLDVAIIGAGIAGLSAGIALKRSNPSNVVRIYEKSTFKNEVGAAITLTPNANRILDRWGFDAKAHGETEKLQVRMVNATTLDVEYQFGFNDVPDRFGHNFNAYHRVDLHRGLRDIAERLGVEILLGEEVVDLDCEEGVLKFKDDTSAEHDLIVVADGIRSELAQIVTGLNIWPQKIGKSVFRGLIPMQHLRDNPLIWKQFENEPSGFYTTTHNGIFFVTYPCSSDEIMNVAIFHTTRAGHEDDEGWSSPATKAEILSVLQPQDVHPFWCAIVDAAPNDDDFKCFPIRFREPIPRCNNARAILIGDAAHPFQPTHAQGGCLGIEDAQSLATLFRTVNNSAPMDVPLRCQLYNDLRMPRGNVTQLYSNVMFYQTNGVLDGEKYVSRLREFYDGPLMPMNVLPWGREHQEFWYSYDVDLEAKKAIEWFEKEGGEGKRLPSGLVKYFY
ncbi:hypothetical protein CERZMDRAFT_84791 [Cercospora zeae-maydis SCOH1-5]|uniref:FAD-binding domain-containing protein n=1 Tax=Cercospora zeae-maydis SCOH1-5 TaxID=717836 RepID=A0A6A6FGA3_9PEZI|nr:hypothetical protein CERZMDRAFT_84791 [Cercospora zeae-maydis SCOH1-5]